ncbi:MAG: o-succinylbenzoate synthase [Mycobacterium sp.]|jgi:O-succinylbenzoate synthase|nr:o-succinylbenzoate synthase [Mycobacterium sp.]
MQTMIDFDDAPIFAMPAFDGIGVREGMLIEGPQGWGEFSPHDDCDDRVAARWLTAAIESGTVGWPDPVRGRVPIAVTVPAIEPRRARDIVANAGCRTAEVRVGERAGSLAGDLARLEAVRDALGADGVIRCRADGTWDVDTAVSTIPALDLAAGGLDYVEQPCHTAPELAAVRARVDVPIATAAPIHPDDPPRASLVGVADVAILRCGPLGGVRRALVIAEACGLPCVVASTGKSSIGLAAGLALAGALPELRHACAFDTTSLLSGDLVAGPRSLITVGGYLPVAPMPPAPDPELITRYAITDPDRIAWWRRRLGAARRSVT